MYLSKLIAFVLLFLLVFGCSQKESPEMTIKDSLSSLIAAERAFARMSKENGTKAAFLEYLAEDGLLFRPYPVNGLQVYLNTRSDAGLLTWQPEFADVSADGSMGFTTGPWQLQVGNVKDIGPLVGHYLSIWQRQADRSWKVALDLGITVNQLGPLSDNVISPVYRRNEPATEQEQTLQAKQLINADRRFGTLSDSLHVSTAYDRMGTKDMRLYRNQTAPLLSREAVVESMRGLSGKFEWSSDTAIVARSGDMGYTYGRMRVIGRMQRVPSEYGYVRIWRKAAEESWKLALDIIIAYPKAEEK